MWSNDPWLAAILIVTIVTVAIFFHFVLIAGEKISEDSEVLIH